jgi:hypothetical protein
VPCDELITRPRSPTDCPWLRNWGNSALCSKSGSNEEESWLWLCRSQIQSQSYFTTGGLPSITSSWHQAPWDSRPKIFLQLNSWWFSLYSLGSDRKKNRLQRFFRCCVFVRCVTMAHFFDEVIVCLLFHCLATDDVSCKAIRSCNNMVIKRDPIRISLKWEKRRL